METIVNLYTIEGIESLPEEPDRYSFAESIPVNTLALLAIRIFDCIPESISVFKI